MCQRYIVPDRKNIKECLLAAERYEAAFEYDDFYIPDLLDDRRELEKRIRFYKELSRDRRNDTMHGAFYDINAASDDARIRETADYRMRQSMDTAMALGVKAVIFHTNCLSGFRLKAYRDHWVRASAAYYGMLLADYPGLQIYVENMFDTEPDLLIRLAYELREQKNFGVCLDYAHGILSGSPAEAWVAQTAPYVKHIHINDNDLREDSHLAVGDGKIDWREYDRLIEKYGLDKKNIGVLLEVAGTEKQIRSAEYLREKGYFPFSPG